MRVHLLAIGHRLPDWVDAGVSEYLKRMPRECSVVLDALPPAKRGKSRSVAQIKAEESERLLARVPKGVLKVALDQNGREWSTEVLGERLARWMSDGRDVALMIGGADGHSDSLLAEADLCWSLSRLTLPHGIARLLVAEQLYRAWSLLRGHPYHRD